MSAGGALRLAAPGAPLGLPTRLLHWSVAVGIVSMLAYGFWLAGLPGGPDKAAAIRAHKSFGVLVLALALARALWRWHEGFPPDAGAPRPWERRLARAMHGALIVATLLMPLTGILRSLAYGRSVSVFGLPVVPKLFDGKQETLYAVAAGLHDRLALVLAVLIGLHVAAALKHHLFDRDETLRRMAGIGP